MDTSYEHTLFDTDSNKIYSLVNPDDHDRFLVDPAYRMEKTEKVLSLKEYDNKIMD